jgi:hypothetical protein
MKNLNSGYGIIVGEVLGENLSKLGLIKNKDFTVVKLIKDIKMSRSRKKHPITGFTCAKSEKENKRIMNRIIRHKVKTQFKTKDLEELEEFLEPKKDEVMDVWSMAKDGKQRFNKNDVYYKKSLRK